ncbi:TetR/AcrR family transcriptional regulator [Marinobacterium jannaschii]|uniref:TetR/AcrR family transcriptional regulator n=1 Tax=Marinobacterium jannaschii TaxID=64970 RepID=UPI0006841BED|nr:TetR/AcrR family transcriptional regulator [Marinobacterium jannaschii]
MAWNPEHKQQTRERILNNAARLFSTRGFDGVSIDQVMQEAGMTRGAFYSHFSSKSALYAESMKFAARQAVNGVKARCSSASPHQMIETYLSQQHRSGDPFRCPLAFLITDVSQQDEAVRQTYTRLFRGFVENLSPQHSAAEREQLLQQAVMMIGGMAIARALSDDKLATELLQACRSAIIPAGTEIDPDQTSA